MAYINVGGTLHNTEVGHVLANADEILDATKNKKQSVVNAEVADELELHGELIGALDRQNYVTVATFGALPQEGEVNTIYRVSSYDGAYNEGEGQVDETKYSEYAWHDNGYILLTVHSQVDEVFDISAYRSGDSYANLTAALDGGNNVPAGIRKGGMSVKFVLTSDNKYVQFRFMLSEFTDAQFTNADNWQGADDETINGSKNLIESGAVYSETHFINKPLLGYINAGNWNDLTSGNRYYTIIENIDAFVGKIVTIKGGANGSAVLNFLSAYNPVEGQSASVVGSQIIVSANETVDVTVPGGAKYLYLLYYSASNNRLPQSVKIESYELMASLKDNALVSFSNTLKVSQDLTNFKDKCEDDKTPYISNEIVGIINSSLNWQIQGGTHLIVTLPTDVGCSLRINTTKTLEAYFLSSNPTPIEGQAAPVIGGSIVGNTTFIIPSAAQYIYIKWNVNRRPDEVLINRVDVLKDISNNTQDIASKVETKEDGDKYIPNTSCLGYITNGIWKDLSTGLRTYKIVKVYDSMVGKTLTIIGRSAGTGVLYFLSAYNPVEDGSASVVGSQIQVSANAIVEVTIPSGAKYLYILSQSTPNDKREPSAIYVLGINLMNALKESLLKIAEQTLIPGSVTEEMLSTDVKNKLVYNVPSYMQDEFVLTKNTLDGLVDGDSCSIALVTDLHITPNPDENNYKAVKESIQTLGVLSEQFPLAFSMALGDYTTGFTPDSKEGGIRCMEKISQWMSSIWGRSNMLAGNHEAKWSGSSPYGLTMPEYLGIVYNKYLQKFGYTIDYKAADINISHCNDEISKTCHIFLNSFSVGHINSAAISQIVNIVSSLPADYGVIIYSHYGVCVWNSLESGSSYENPVVFSQVKDAIDAIKTAITGTTKELICWVGGHTHTDDILVYNDTPVICLLRSAFGNQEGASQDGITYTNKVMGSPTMETSTILTVRRNLGKLYFTRIGCGVNMEANYKATGGQTIGRVWNSLSGIVYASDGTTPIEGATVFAKFIGATYTATTNSSGEYSFDKLPKEAGVLSVSVTGYEFEDISLSISGSMTQDVIAES